MLALQRCSRQLYFVAVTSYVLYIFHCGLWLFDGISVFRHFNGQEQLYLLQSGSLEFAGTISHSERGCGYSAG